MRVGSAAAGNAATRIEAFVLSTGTRAHGGYPYSAPYEDLKLKASARP